MERGRPGSALICTGDFAPEGCVVNATGIAVIPREGYKKEILGTGGQDPGKRPEFGEAYAEEPVYNEIVRCGDYVFTVGDWSSDYETGIRPDVKTDDWIWWGNEVRNESRFILETLSERLETAGTSLANAAHCSVFLMDIGDLYEVDLIWKKFFPTDPPRKDGLPDSRPWHTSDRGAEDAHRGRDEDGVDVPVGQAQLRHEAGDHQHRRGDAGARVRGRARGSAPLDVRRYGRWSGWTDDTPRHAEPAEPHLRTPRRHLRGRRNEPRQPAPHSRVRDRPERHVRGVRRAEAGRAGRPTLCLHHRGARTAAGARRLGSSSTAWRTCHECLRPVGAQAVLAPRCGGFSARSGTARRQQPWLHGSLARASASVRRAMVTVSRPAKSRSLPSAPQLRSPRDTRGAPCCYACDTDVAGNLRGGVRTRTIVEGHENRPQRRALQALRKPAYARAAGRLRRALKVLMTH